MKPDTPVGAVQRGRLGRTQVGKPRSATHKQLRGKFQSQSSQSPTSRSRCGRSPPHDLQSCPAKDAVCHKCSKRGHFEAVCWTRGVKGIHEETNDKTSQKRGPFLGVIDANNVTNNPWRLSVSLSGLPTEFDIDTGTKVLVISDHKKISPPLFLPDRRLKGPSNCPLPVKGSDETR